MGYIYIIKNDINNKVYIGQTIHNIKKRWNAHKSLVGKSEHGLYVDMYNFGVEHFSIGILEECSDTVLNEREKFFIRKYNSYNNGYNGTVGGSASIKYTNLVERIIDDLFIKSIREICAKYNVSEQYVKVLRQDIGLETCTSIKHSNDKKQLVMYDTNFENPVLFSSIKDAVTYLKVDRRNFSRSLNRACNYGLRHYDHKWQWAHDLTYEDKIFRTKFEKEAYIGGYHAYKPEGKGYWVVDGVLSSYITNRGQTITNRAFCKCCGARISYRTKSRLCIGCSQVKAKNMVNKPSKVQLEYDLKHYSLAEIASKYNRTKSTIYYWIKQYNI